MASSQTPSRPMQSQYGAVSPLDQLAVQGGLPGPSSPRTDILDRAKSLSRTATVTRRPQRPLQQHREEREQQQPLRHPQQQEQHTAQDDSSASSKERRLSQQQQQVQDLRAARLQRQHMEHAQRSAPQSPPQAQEADWSDSSDSRLGFRNAFRDSVASDMSFNSVTGDGERASMMGFANQSGYSDESTSLDQIADEVRGLALRRRQSVDTVRSSEFGDGGRWANAWSGSDVDDDDDQYGRQYGGGDDKDDDDEEISLQALRGRDMTDVDIENSNGPSTLGALAHLGSTRGARDVMVNKNAGAASFPPLQQAAGVEHTVTLTPSARGPRLATSNATRSNQAQRPAVVTNGDRPQAPIAAHTHRAVPSRRDTITSMLGEVEDYEDSKGEDASTARYSGGAPQHTRSDSASTISAHSNYTSNNSHVRVWPPTPAVSDTSSARGRSTGGPGSHTYNGLQTFHTGERAVIEDARNENTEDSSTRTYRAHPSAPTKKPLSPSAALARPPGDSILSSTSPPQQRLPKSQGQSDPTADVYSNPNLPEYPSGLDALGERRRKAIAEHDGRESMVSDLDVETLRLDGSSNSGGSSDDWDSRRASTSTVGTVSSAYLDEQRRRRSQLERDQDDRSGRRSSVATLKGPESPIWDGPASRPSHPGDSEAFPGNYLRRQVSQPSPSKERANPFEAKLPQPPRRSNTQPSGATPLSPASPNNAPNSSMRSVTFEASKTGGQAGAPGSPYSPRSPSLAGSTMSPVMTSASRLSTHTSGASIASRRTKTKVPSAAQSKAENFLTLGIQHHESGDLSRSAYYFERSAKIEGGCVVGMCMWGMALREGWGVRKDQKRGFEWISRAAARAGELMASGGDGPAPRTEAELKAIRSELKLSVYELGKCFCYGWGVKMDKQMALEYFELAAKLGDADAQAEAGALLAAGKGCKKDLKKAATYYRMAEAQGYDTVGLSWIHKDKYDAARAK